MIGVWQRFGQGQPPRDGEAVVYLEFPGASAADIIEHRSGGRVVVAIHRWGMLIDQNGNGGPPPYGSLWTSLPDASMVSA